jgi:hypothetical protein
MDNSKMSKCINLIIIIGSILTTELFAGYNWPCKPFDQQHGINGTFCENRPSGSIDIHHFHNGVDIDLAGGNEVYSIISGQVKSLYRTGGDAYIRIGRYAYVHVTPRADIDVGDNVTAYETIIGYTNYKNHIHLTDGYVGSEINALRPDGMTPLSDPYDPIVSYVKFYVDGTTTEFQSGKVSGLVDIVARLYDKTDNGTYGTNNGVYIAGYQIYDSTGTTALSDPYTPYQFDNKPDNSFVTNVYFPGSDLSTYLYILTNSITANGYWDTRFYSPGKYKIKVFIEDTRDNRKEYWETVEVEKQDIYPPAKPVITSYTGDAQGDWRLNWLKNDSTDIAGYDFYYSLNGTTYQRHDNISNSLGIEDTTWFESGYGYTYPLYVKLRAYDNSALKNYSDFSNAYVVKLSESGADFLIVDGFDRTNGYWQEKRHDFVSTYAAMLIDEGFALNSCADDAVASGRVSLSDYKNIVYFTGDDAGETDALSLDEKLSIRNYLEQGGNLFICGSDIAADLYVKNDTLFLKDYLKVQFQADSSNTLIVENTAQTLQAEICNPLGINPACDILIPQENTEVIFKYNDGQTAGIFYSGYFGSSTTASKLVFTGFPLELLTDDTNRQAFFDEVLNYLDAYSGVDDDYAAQPFNPILVSNYPNPFNPGTKIKYVVPQKGAASIVKINVYDISGRLVKKLINDKMKPGVYEVCWNGKDNLNNNVCSGIYFCRYQTGAKQTAIKLVLIR